MPDNDVERLVTMFTAFAVHEFAGQSTRWELLSRAIAEAPGLGEPLLSAPPRQRLAILYFAATQYLLRGPARGHPLAAYLPTLGGTREPDGGFLPAFAAFVRDHGGELAALCASRTTQTNEPLRAALLRPAFAHAAAALDGRPVGLVELGTSAGLLLIPDRYGYQYGSASYGRPDAPAALTLRCELRGTGRPELDRAPEISDRIGLDLHPVDATDPASTDWLRSCIWPEHVHRLARLAPVLSTVDAVPLVFASHALMYLSRQARADLVHTLDGIGAQRDLVLVVNGDAENGLRMFASDSPPPEPGMAVGTLTVVTWLGGRATVTALGKTAPHGQWLHWDPVEYAYRPPALARS